MRVLAIVLIVFGVVVVVLSANNYMYLAKLMDETAVYESLGQRMLNSGVGDPYERRSLNDTLTDTARVHVQTRARQREDIAYMAIGVILALVGAGILIGQSATRKPHQDPGAA